jgi:cytochrome c oxidase subunit 2
LPSLGIKIDAIPGRINSFWFFSNAHGQYYGQCSELCGSLHGFMPIKITIL